MRRKSIILCTCLVFAFALAGTAAAQSLTQQELLGKYLLFDTNLSANANQSCAACHAPSVGWTGPESAINATGSVYEGSICGRFGNRKPPTAAYAGFSPVLSQDATTGAWTGGMFWDGRATGSRLGDPLAEQALGPFLNPLEQALPDAAAVVNKVKASRYKRLFARVCGGSSIPIQYDCIGQAIAAYERSFEVTQFSSKFDTFWANAQAAKLDVTLINDTNYTTYAGKGLDDTELLGLGLFNSKGNCSACHSLTSPDGTTPPLFTDYTYDNLGIPRNPMNPFYYEPQWNPLQTRWRDLGLGGFLKSAKYPASVYGPEIGKFKVPTLRNVDLRPAKAPCFVKAYGHNGYFKSLESITHFYNTASVKPVCTNVSQIPGKDCWPAPEVKRNVNRTELGDLKLTPAEEAAIVSFMKTLSDTKPVRPPRY